MGGDDAVRVDGHEGDEAAVREFGHRVARIEEEVAEAQECDPALPGEDAVGDVGAVADDDLHEALGRARRAQGRGAQGRVLLARELAQAAQQDDFTRWKTFLGSESPWLIFLSHFISFHVLWYMVENICAR